MTVQTAECGGVGDSVRGNTEAVVPFPCAAPQANMSMIMSSMTRCLETFSSISSVVVCSQRADIEKEGWRTQQHHKLPSCNTSPKDNDSSRLPSSVSSAGLDGPDPTMPPSLKDKEVLDRMVCEILACSLESRRTTGPTSKRLS